MNSKILVLSGALVFGVGNFYSENNGNQQGAPLASCESRTFGSFFRMPRFLSSFSSFGSDEGEGTAPERLDRIDRVLPPEVLAYIMHLAVRGDLVEPDMKAARAIVGTNRSFRTAFYSGLEKYSPNVQALEVLAKRTPEDFKGQSALQYVCTKIVDVNSRIVQGFEVNEEEIKYAQMLFAGSHVSPYPDELEGKNLRGALLDSIRSLFAFMDNKHAYCVGLGYLKTLAVSFQDQAVFSRARNFFVPHLLRDVRGAQDLDICAQGLEVLSLDFLSFDDQERQHICDLIDEAIDSGLENLEVAGLRAVKNLLLLFRDVPGDAPVEPEVFVRATRLLQKGLFLGAQSASPRVKFYSFSLIRACCGRLGFVLNQAGELGLQGGRENLDMMRAFVGQVQSKIDSLVQTLDSSIGRTVLKNYIKITMQAKLEKFQQVVDLDVPSFQHDILPALLAGNPLPEEIDPFGLLNAQLAPFVAMLAQLDPQMIVTYAEVVDGIMPMIRLAARVDEAFIDSMIAWLFDDPANRDAIIDIAKDMSCACLEAQKALGSCLAALDALALAKNKLLKFGTAV